MSRLGLRRNPSETRGHLAETCWMRDEPSKQSFTTTRSLHGLLLRFHPGCVWVHDNNTMTDNHCSSFRAGSLAIGRAQNVIPKSLKKYPAIKNIPLFLQVRSSSHICEIMANFFAIVSRMVGFFVKFFVL